jgi:hypothetical protein
MNSFIKKGLSVLLIGMMTVVFGFTAQAKKAKKDKEPYLGPTVEECKTSKKGDERCKTKNLHGQKAIEFIYQALLESNAAIAENADNIAALEVDTEDLQGQINVLVTEISDNDGEIATNAADISDLFSQLSDLQTLTAEQAHDILGVRADLSTLASTSAEQAAVVQGQISDLQGQITTNNGDTLALLENLRGLVDSQGIMLGNVKIQITDLDGKINTQVELLQAAIASVQSNLDDQELFSAEQFQYATDQRTLILADILALQVARDGLNDKADAMQTDIIASTDKITTIETQAANRMETIIDMQKDLIQISLDIAQKQDIINGTCSYGKAISAISADGTLVCTTNVTGIQRYYVTKYVYIPPGTATQTSEQVVKAECPYQSIAIEWDNYAAGLEVIYDYKNERYHRIKARNFSDTGRNLHSKITCLGLTTNGDPIN